MSTLIYRPSILQCQIMSIFEKNTNRLIHYYLWKKKRETKKNSLIGNILEGGIGVVDIETKFKSWKAAWIPWF